MAAIPFLRLQSCGNDFLLIDDREATLAGREVELAKAVCRRGISEGADGLLLAARPIGDGFVRMRLINADGSEGEMCGNGAVAFARAASERFGAGETFEIETLGGLVGASVAPGTVQVELRSLSGKVDRLHLEVLDRTIDVGYLEIYRVPHAVVQLSPGDAGDGAVGRLGRALRHHAAFPRGANVNFVTGLSPGVMELRTYERGVEAETLSCGTGSIASVLACREDDEPGLMNVRSRGGQLTVRTTPRGAGWRVEITGHPRLIAEGVLLDESWAP